MMPTYRDSQGNNKVHGAFSCLGTLIFPLLFPCYRVAGTAWLTTKRLEQNRTDDDDDDDDDDDAQLAELIVTLGLGAVVRLDDILYNDSGDTIYIIYPHFIHDMTLL